MITCMLCDKKQAEMIFSPKECVYDFFFCKFCNWIIKNTEDFCIQRLQRDRVGLCAGVGTGESDLIFKLSEYLGARRYFISGRAIRDALAFLVDGEVLVKSDNGVYWRKSMPRNGLTLKECRMRTPVYKIDNILKQLRKVKQQVIAGGRRL